MVFLTVKKYVMQFSRFNIEIHHEFLKLVIE